MRKLVLLLALLFVVSPLFAMFCQNCGAKMADDAKFCPQCGKARVAATAQMQPTTTPAPVPFTPTQPQQVPVVVSPVPPSAPIVPAGTPLFDSFVREFEEIDRYESFLFASAYYRAMGRTMEFQRSIREHLNHVANEYPQLNPAMQKMHALYVKKFELLDSYLEAWGEATKGPFHVQGEARKTKFAFKIQKVDEIISVLKNNRTEDEKTILMRVNDMESDLEYSTREYTVTSHFIRLDDFIISHGQRFWIIDMQSDRARVMYLGEATAAAPVTGWVTIADLASHTDWRMEAHGTVLVPASVPTTSVVVVDRGPRPYYGINLVIPMHHHQYWHDDHRRW